MASLLLPKGGQKVRDGKKFNLRHNNASEESSQSQVVSGDG